MFGESRKRFLLLLSLWERPGEGGYLPNSPARNFATVTCSGSNFKLSKIRRILAGPLGFPGNDSYPFTADFAPLSARTPFPTSTSTPPPLNIQIIV